MLDDPYAELRKLSLTDRIRAIAEDVRSGRDRFRSDDTHGLADLLGIDASRPSGDWSRMNVVDPVDLSEVARDSDEIECGWIYDLKGQIAADRFAELVSIAEHATPYEFDVEVLNDFEKKFIAQRIAAERLSNDGRYIPLAHITIVGISGEELTFEARIEDDGDCCDLLGPYDERDGAFHDLEGCEVDEF